MSLRYNKTPAGHYEVLVNELEMSRAQRNLLVVINSTQPLGYWLSNIRGVGETDIARLLQMGMIAEADAAPAAAPEHDEVVDEWRELLAALAQADAETLRRELRTLAWPLLKGVRAYRFAQDVETAQDVAELRQMANAFAAQVRGELGETAVTRLHQAFVTHSGSDGFIVSRAAHAHAHAPAAASATTPAAASASAQTAMPAAASVAHAVPAAAATPTAAPAIANPAKSESAVTAAPGDAFRLRRWPNTRALGRPEFARLASLLTSRSLSLTQLTQLGRVESPVVLEFLRAMREMGLLEVKRVESTGASSVDTARIASIMPAAAMRPAPAAAVSFGFLGRLRERLGLR